MHGTVAVHIGWSATGMSAPEGKHGLGYFWSMASGSVVSIQPAVLEWAIHESGHPLERVADAIPVKEERLRAWLSADLQPSLRQVEKLAKFLHRPFGLFFLPVPPKLPPLAAEYRRLPGVRPGKEGPQLRLALRQMLARREAALELMEELGEEPEAFAMAARLREGAEAVGGRLRLALGIPMEEQLAWRGDSRAWNAWREAVERMGVLVFQFGKVPLDEVRGLALLRQPLPVVGINTKEQPGTRSFTLLHEVAHIMLANGREEVAALDERGTEKEWQRMERFAEQVAAAALMPLDALHAIVREQALEHGPWTMETVRKLARRFRVTPLAMATRLSATGYMDRAQYGRWRKDWDAYVATLPPRKGGHATQAQKAIGRNGRPFTTLVLSALAADRITSVDAARHLGLKFHHFDDLRTRLVHGAERDAA